MNEKIASAKAFVKKHKTAIACTTGVVVGVTATYFALTRETNTVVLLNDTDLALINSGDASRHENKRGVIRIAREVYLPEN